MNVETKLGSLKAWIANDIEYPGICVGLDRDGVRTIVAVIEVDESEDKPVLKAHVYNTEDDDPVFSLRESAEDIEKYFGVTHEEETTDVAF